MVDMTTHVRIDDLVEASATRIRRTLLRRAVGAEAAGAAVDGSGGAQAAACWAAAADRVPELLEEWRRRTRQRARRAQVHLMPEAEALRAVHAWLKAASDAFAAESDASRTPVDRSVLREVAELVQLDVAQVLEHVRDVHTCDALTFAGAGR